MQLELMDRCLKFKMDFYLFLTCGVESGGSFNVCKTKPLGFLGHLKNIFYYFA